MLWRRGRTAASNAGVICHRTWVLVLSKWRRAESRKAESVRITVVGVGYVGLVTAVCLADGGNEVTCVDIDAEKIGKLQQGVCTIWEPGIEEMLVSNLEAGRLIFRTPEAGWAGLIGDLVFIAVGTPANTNGGADLSQVRSVVSQLAADTERPFTLVMKSTVPPGTGAALREHLLASAAHRIGYVSNPEFLREGRAVHDWYQADRVVLGAADPSDLPAVRDLYADIEALIVETDIASAETIKYASNGFLSTKISFINEMANLCDAVGADIDAVSLGVGLDRRIGPEFLHAGIGYGGSCFPKDTRALDFVAMLHGYQFALLKSVIEVNNRQRLLPVVYLTKALKDLHAHKVALLGLSFKPDTNDVRESPALDIAPLLLELGAQVQTYDAVAAVVDIPGTVRCESVWEALDGASAAIVITGWPEFVELDWQHARSVMAEPGIIFDGRNCLDPLAIEAAGLSYAAVGRPGIHRL